MSIDCHAHVIDPVRFPYADGPGYKPGADETGNAPAFRAALRANGFDRGLLVQPSCYGFDNAAMLDAIVASDGAFKGIAVVPAEATPGEMIALRGQGVVGARLNVGSFDPDFFRRPEATPFLDRCVEVDWLVEIYAVGDAWEHIAPVVAASRARIIVDHIGHPDPARGLDQPGFRAMLSLAARRASFVKLSGFFRVSLQPWPHADVEPFVRAAIEAFGVENCLWGSDWPFINTSRKVRYDEQLALLSRWVPDVADRRKILVENPSRLFGFAST